mmetsp:Transcript_55298/g.165754  ORF Transcript_55298/g.165754 Transcript_55298/m.165754 type:complete len:205 (+) Transcript_55298:256-870(+)
MYTNPKKCFVCLRILSRVVALYPSKTVAIFGRGRAPNPADHVLALPTASSSLTTRPSCISFDTPTCSCRNILLHPLTPQLKISPLSGGASAAAAAFSLIMTSCSTSSSGRTRHSSSYGGGSRRSTPARPSQSSTARSSTSSSIEPRAVVNPPRRGRNDTTSPFLTATRAGTSTSGRTRGRTLPARSASRRRAALPLPRRNLVPR